MSVAGRREWELVVARVTHVDLGPRGSGTLVDDHGVSTTARNAGAVDGSATVLRCDRDLPYLSSAQARDLTMVLSRIVAALHPERIFAFGSQARGDARPDSDIDLLLVVSDIQEPPYRLAQAAYRAAGAHTLDLDILVMPSEEFALRARAPSSLPATVLREGRLLYAA